MESIFIHLAIILSSAFIISYIVRALNQPIIVGHILAGIIISPFLLLEVGNSLEIIDIFSEFGVAFLLFIVGLHLNPKVIKEIGISSLVVGLSQILIIFFITYLISFFLLQLDSLPSIYLGIALSFSSTIIIMKLLSDKKQLDSLFGKISIGILIIQDLVAIGVLMFISSLSRNSNNILGVKGLISGGILILILFFIGYFILPKIMKSIAKSQEMLFLFSICWCFILAGLFSYVGFGMEIGALVAGVILSSNQYSTEISSKIRPLRDFFLIIFFIILGLEIQITNLKYIVFDALILSGVALILKPLILMTLMKYFGYTKRTNFLVGSTLAQISEFSLIILSLGVMAGHISSTILSTGVLTLVITILISSYIIIYSERFYKLILRFLLIFEKKTIKKERKLNKTYDAVLFGYNRMGFSVLNSLKKLKKDYLVVDFNPDTISNLKKCGVPSLYGDVYDSELLEELPLEKINLAISTIPDIETNELLIDEIRIKNKKAAIIVRADNIEDALKLYSKGANYVLTPHFLGGEYVANMIENIKFGEEGFTEERIKHVKMLKNILAQGHEHPSVEKN